MSPPLFTYLIDKVLRMLAIGSLSSTTRSAIFPTSSDPISSCTPNPSAADIVAAINAECGESPPISTRLQSSQCNDLPCGAILCDPTALLAPRLNKADVFSTSLLYNCHSFNLYDARTRVAGLPLLYC